MLVNSSELEWEYLKADCERYRLKTENLLNIAQIDFEIYSNEKFECESFLTQLSSRLVVVVVVVGENKMDEVGGVLLLHGVRHQLLLGALRADDVLPVRDESLPHHAGLAR